MPKKKQPEREPDEKAPKAVGGVWPFRQGSAMHVCFWLCFYGITPAAFEAEFKKGGSLYGIAKHDFMLERMKRGRPGRRKGPQSHSWDFKLEGGKYWIFNVQYLLGLRKKAA